jgi:hypothetical protein
VGVKKSISPKTRRASPIKRPKIENMRQEISYLLEEGTLESLQKGKQLSQEHIKYQWDLYSELSFQRNAIVGDLMGALSEKCVKDFEFQSWQRVVRWKYTNHPFCTMGSLKQYGGRFNIGEGISPSGAFKIFPAFYIAQDQLTAKLEAFGSQLNGIKLTPEEISLTNKRSYACISVSGTLDRIIDLTKKSSLTKFTQLISTFKLPSSIYETAQKLNLPKPTLITTPKLLLESFMSNNWRREPSQFDIPANCQIFGQLAFNAGIDGILFKSAKSSKLCLSIFPSNFVNGSSFMSLDDEPPENWIIKKIDLNNFFLCEKDAAQIRSMK